MTERQIITALSVLYAVLTVAAIWLFLRYA